jgi:hypothetical protein
MCKSKDILISAIAKPSARAKAALYEYLGSESGGGIVHRDVAGAGATNLTADVPNGCI